jgi:hypothetical protein
MKRSLTPDGINVDEVHFDKPHAANLSIVTDGLARWALNGAH